jgi:hypothetical protein
MAKYSAGEIGSMTINRRLFSNGKWEVRLTDATSRKLRVFFDGDILDSNATFKSNLETKLLTVEKRQAPSALSTLKPELDGTQIKNV